MQLPMDVAGTQVKIKVDAPACGDYPEWPEFDQIPTHSVDELTYQDVHKAFTDEDTFMAKQPVHTINGANQRCIVPTEDGIMILVSFLGRLTPHDAEQVRVKAMATGTYSYADSETIGMDSCAFTVVAMGRTVDRKLTDSMVGVYQQLVEQSNTES